MCSAGTASRRIPAKALVLDHLLSPPPTEILTRDRSNRLSNAPPCEKINVSVFDQLRWFDP
jgi:hypothetical protein